jgi:molybdenum cofactor cytidylyltransferase
MPDPTTGFEGAVAIVLAAGLSRRFGTGDKLLHDLDGLPVGAHIAETLTKLPFRRRVAICGTQLVADLYRDRGFDVAINEAPAAGLGRSLQIGIDAAGATDLLLVCLSDMPFVGASHLKTLFDALNETGADIVASRAEAYRGPPALIRRKAFQDRKFEGDQGARAMLYQAILVRASERQMLDIDTIIDLKNARTSKR